MADHASKKGIIFGCGLFSFLYRCMVSTLIGAIHTSGEAIFIAEFFSFTTVGAVSASEQRIDP
jgi:hypothetical protein